MIAEMTRLKGLAEGIEVVLDAIVASEFNAIARVPWIWVNAGGKPEGKTGGSVVTGTTAATATRTHKSTTSTSTLGMGSSNKLTLGHHISPAAVVKSSKTTATGAAGGGDGEYVSSRPLAQLALDVMQEAIETIAQIKQTQKNIQSTAMQVLPTAHNTISHPSSHPISHHIPLHIPLHISQRVTLPPSHPLIHFITHPITPPSPLPPLPLTGLGQEL